MAWLSRIWSTFRTGKLDHELNEEIAHHLQLRAEDLQRSGVPEAEARKQAALRFGNFTFEKENMRDMDIATSLESIGKDLQYAFRQLLRNKTFSIVAVGTLALAIGANTALFSIFNAALLRSLPVREPSQLVIFTNPDASGAAVGSMDGERDLLTYSEYEQLRDHLTEPAGTLVSVCASDSSLNRWNVSIAGAAQEEARGRLVSENYFQVLGVEPVIGHIFTQAEAASIGGDPYAVISYDYWQQRFGGNENVLGTRVRIANAMVTVIGVAQRGFHGETVGEAPSFWIPMLMEPLVKPGRDWIHEDLSKSIEKVMWLHVFGRLKPGVTLKSAQVQANAFFKSLMAATYPTTLPPATRKQLLNQSLRLRSARTGAFGGRTQFSQQLLILMAVAGLVLLIACANVANLLLARATARQREVSIRLSLGAGKSRLFRQFMTESLFLSGAAGVLGAALAIVAARGLLSMISDPTQPVRLSASLDWRVLVFTLAITLLTGLLFGVVPALRGAPSGLAESLKASGRGATDTHGRATIAKTLVGVQVALSLLLIAGAGLFLRTLWNLQSVMLGYSKENLLLIRVDALSAGYKDNQRAPLFSSIAERIGKLPGVRSTAYSENGLLAGTESADPVKVEGFVQRGKEAPIANFDQIGPAYFSALGIPLVLGREFGPFDAVNSQRVCVINQAFAKRFFAGRNPLGKRVTDVYGGANVSFVVVGVSKDLRDHKLRGDISSRFYVPITQGLGGIPDAVYFEIRSVGSPEPMLNSVRRAIVQVDPNLAILTARKVDDLVAAQTRLPRLIAELCTAFGLLALVLAATGLYGVLSYTVGRRTSEIGLRVALGAERRDVIGMILRETSTLVFLGMLAGVALTFAMTRLVANRLYGLSAMDPATITMALVILGLVAFASSYLPASRAARINPVTALRNE